MSRLVDRDGWAFVEEQSEDYKEPILWRLYYPTGVRTHDIKYNLGLVLPIDIEQERYCADPGMYRHTFAHGRFIQIRLADGRETKPAHSEQEPIKPPRKVRNHRWIWEYGKWKKERSDGHPAPRWQ